MRVNGFTPQPRNLHLDSELSPEAAESAVLKKILWSGLKGAIFAGLVGATVSASLRPSNLALTLVAGTSAAIVSGAIAATIGRIALQLLKPQQTRWPIARGVLGGAGAMVAVVSFTKSTLPFLLQDSTLFGVQLATCLITTTAGFIGSVCSPSFSSVCISAGVGGSLGLILGEGVGGSELSLVGAANGGIAGSLGGIFGLLGTVEVKTLPPPQEQPQIIYAVTEI